MARQSGVQPHRRHSTSKLADAGFVLDCQLVLNYSFDD
jgi:hypothetical protein